jgi:anti-sigma B factor antagonist
MEINFEQKIDVAVVSVNGSVDAFTTSELTDYLHNKIDSGHNKVVIDLSQVDFMSSAGLRAILMALKATRRNDGDLRLAGAQPGVEKILKMSGFNMILKSLPTLEEALHDF